MMCLQRAVQFRWITVTLKLAGQFLESRWGLVSDGPLWGLYFHLGLDSIKARQSGLSSAMSSPTDTSEVMLGAHPHPLECTG